MGRAPPTNDLVNEIFGRLPPTPVCLHHESPTVVIRPCSKSAPSTGLQRRCVIGAQLSGPPRLLVDVRDQSHECASRFAAEASRGAGGSALGFTETRSSAAGRSGTRCMAGWAS